MAQDDPIPALPIIPETAELTAVSLGPAQPLVMLPVRLETRFFSRDGGGMELRVRVYPDKIHIDTHEPHLIEQEVTWGKHFWEQTWRAADDDEARKLAWRQLVDRFGTGRAAWVARALRPVNTKDRPAEFVSNDQSLPKPIIFPEVETKAEAWTRAPVAGVFPSRWHVLGYSRGELILKASGNPIPGALPAGPDPQPFDKIIPEDQLAIDEGMKWMVDFAKAEEKGMGISIPLDQRQAEGFDFLLVVGTRESASGADESKELAALLDAHHYTDGLSFVLQGTPTNNTADAPSGFSSSDPGHEESYLAERDAKGFTTGDGSNADVLTSAFGFGNGNAQTFAHLGNAAVTEQVDAGHMNRALWAATWGYFLMQMMNGSPLTAEDCDWAREHFADYVRAAGPLPAIRVGRQPYGILPVTSLNLWRAKTGQEVEQNRDAVLRDFLVRLSAVWRNNLPEVPRVGRTADKPDKDFADILSMDGLSSRYAIRHLMGRAYLEKLWSVLFMGDQKFWWDRQIELTKAALNLVGLDWKPRLSNATYSGWYKELKNPVIQPETLNEKSPLAPNYIELLLKESDYDKLWQEKFDQFQPKGLLYSLLRHSLLWEYYAAAGDLIAFKGTNSNIRFFEGEEEVFTPHELMIWSLLKKPLSEFAAIMGKPLTGITGDSFWNFLFALESLPADPEIAKRVSALLKFRDSASRLKSISAARLERLLAGTLDLCSHRLDAWISSFATKRLAEIRKTSPKGILVGGYGWVVNLRPRVAVTATAPSTDAQIISNNPGFTHAPSLAHAATVAVLRSGHLTHSAGESANGNLLAIDLSSERVRLAEWLLDGVRQGQPLGALLGYRFERRLQDARLGDYIPAFREVAPLVAKRLEETADQETTHSVESIAANNVVDGLFLHDKWKKMKELARVSLSLSGPLAAMLAPVDKKPDADRFAGARSGLEAALDLLDDAVDAVSDALIAESVHQAVQGNPLRVASTLDAIARGAAPPSELEVVRTPRTGTALVHRVVTLFSGPPAMPTEWGTPLVPFRAHAEPNLNAWAAKLLGDPARVKCVIERIDPATAATLENKELRLSELQLSPLDFIYAAEGSRDAQPSEIEQRILYAIRRQAGSFAAADMLRINPARADGLPVSELGYGEFAELLRTARAVITGARGIDASELNLPERNQPASIDIDELKTRADQAEHDLSQTGSELREPASDGAADLESLRAALLRAAHFGIPGAVPVSASGDSTADREALRNQAKSIAVELDQRAQALSAMGLAFDSVRASEDEKQKHHLARLRLAFGDSFVVLPRFSAGNSNELKEALADSTAVQDNDALAVFTWFQRASRVRASVARLDSALRYAEALDTGEKLKLRVIQLPHDPKGRWVGLPLLPGRELFRSGLSLVVQSADELNVNEPLAGLLIDEWVEVVPNVNETTAVTFQYDQPDAAPPQCILLAVPPDLERPWDLRSLPQVLLETLDLARLRAVDSDTLDDVGHYLPALYFAVNTGRDTAAIDFSS